MLLEFLIEARELPWQPKLCKKTKFLRFQFCKCSEDNVCVYYHTRKHCLNTGFSGSENSNMLIKILGKQRVLP